MLAVAADWYEARGASSEAVSALREAVASVRERGVRWQPIAEIEDGRAPTYDFVVPGDHSFIGNAIVNHNTPLHALDLHGWLAKNEEFFSKRYPGILDYNGPNERALFPQLWTVERLKRRKRLIGNVAFTREILVEPISDDLSLFPFHLFPPLYEPHLTIRPTIEQIRERGWTTYMGVDVAISASVGADYFVMFVIGVDRQGNHHVVDIRRHRGMPFNTQLENIEHWAKYYDCQLVLIEANQAQKVWSDEMKRTTDVPVKEFVTLASNKYPLDKGMPSLRILIENGKIRIPRGNHESVVITDEWINEMVQFGFFQGKLQGTGAHDDQAMAFWFSCEAKKLGGFGFSFGDDDEDDEDFDDDDEDFESILYGTDDDDDGEPTGPKRPAAGGPPLVGMFDV